MLLPEGIHRENNKMYEEVEIPPNEPMPIGFEERPVFISELDEVGAICAVSFFLFVIVKCVWISKWDYSFVFETYSDISEGKK